MIIVREVNPVDKDVCELIEELDAYQLSIYPEESNHLDSAQTFVEENAFFVGAFLDSSLIGIGAQWHLLKGNQG